MVACPLKGLVGQPSSLKIATFQVHLLFAQHHGGSWPETLAREFPPNELE
jgi:hypothetical protein